MTRRVVLCTVAHPDDDVMGAAGFMALHRDECDLRFILLHASDGEAGEIAHGTGIKREELGAVRRREDEAGWRVIGRMPDRHEWLGLPDGKVAEHREHLSAQIAGVMAEERPDVVFAFGPDGITGHPDHIAVGAATTAVFLRFAAEGGPGFERLFHAAYKQSALDRLNQRLIAKGMKPHDPAVVYQLRGVPDERIACTMNQRPVVPLIRAAFREHRSQWSPYWAEMDDDAWYSAAGESHLVQAWPPRDDGAPLLGDPLEGL